METHDPPVISNAMKRTLLLLSILSLAIGNCGGPLIMRLYFVHGGNRIWLSSFLQTGGWPILFIPLIISYIIRRKTEGPNTTTTKLIFVKRPAVIAASGIGLIGGITNYNYAFGVAHLPVSTSALISASTLAFTAFFAFLIVKQKFTPYSTNAIFLLTIGTVVLALHASSDRPKGESNKLYILGFVLTIVSSGLSGLMMPLIELIYKCSKEGINFTFAMEIQLVLCFVASVVCTVGMIINDDFKVIPREAKEYELGEVKYYTVLVFSAIIWQFFLLGTIGIIFTASALVSGIMVSVLLPVTEVLAVIFFHDKFQAEKGISLVLSLWGFGSYIYGEMKSIKKKNQIQETEIVTA